MSHAARRGETEAREAAPIHTPPQAEATLTSLFTSLQAGVRRTGRRPLSSSGTHCPQEPCRTRNTRLPGGSASVSPTTPRSPAGGRVPWATSPSSPPATAAPRAPLSTSPVPPPPGAARGCGNDPHSTWRRGEERGGGGGASALGRGYRQRGAWLQAAGGVATGSGEAWLGGKGAWPAAEVGGRGGARPSPRRREGAVAAAAAV